jgi:hypothetical protein
LQEFRSITRPLRVALAACAALSLGMWLRPRPAASAAVADQPDSAQAEAKTDGQPPSKAASHWAWRAPVLPAFPKVDRVDWPKNPIDYFVLARLERDGLAPSPAADRYTLLRRLSLDLIGLPPTPKEIDEFVNDTRPDAVERVVDRLLADEGYGERWARMWLDLARYADSKGYGSDPLRTIWRYRDWVIDAFNRNEPYDRFTIEQLAGDLLTNPTHDQLLATAFHRNTMANDEGGTDDEQFRVEAVKDRVDSTMQIWMGITMGCAKCHTHKYDPITQKEYYSFFAFFNQSEDADRGDEEPRLRSPSREQQARMDSIKSQVAELQSQIESPAGEIGERLIASQDRWEQSVADSDAQWVALAPSEARTANGTVLERLDDRSFLATVANPETEVYTLTVPTELSNITAIRLEALPDESLPGKGPGRAGGNFVLNDLQLQMAGRAGKRPAGRYVRIEIPGQHRILSLAEVQVFGARAANGEPEKVPAGEPDSGGNIARGAKATQSSVDYGGEPERAIDGNTNGHYFDAQSTTHTQAEDNPWWELDLGTVRDVERVVIWNRTDGGVGTRLTNFRVALLGEDRKPIRETKVADPPNPSASLNVGAPATIAIKSAASDFDQSDFSVAKAIDNDATAKSGWAIAPKLGSRHSAIFELAKPAGPEGGSEWTIVLTQAYGTQHTLGRFRLSATTVSPPPRPIPSQIREILEIARANRSNEQQAEIARYYRSISPELQPLRERVAKLEQQMKELDKQVPLIPIMRELAAEKRRETHVLIKSNFLLPGDAVEAGVPAAFPPFAAGEPTDRLGMAQWLMRRDNPLTARVAVNRFWSQIFGKGLVETEEDFGTQGLPPSHPELLDWLALQFMGPENDASVAAAQRTCPLCGPVTKDASGAQRNWNIKALVRLIVTSATYQQSSTPAPDLARRDPDNRLLARGPRHRLEAEMVRDQALALAGLLSRKIGGPSVYPPQPDGLWRAAFNGERTWATSTGEDRYRRGLYTFWRRTVPYPSMATFDAPSREICTLRRTPTNTPLQAFVTLNDPVYVEAAQALARRIVREGGASDADRASYGLRLCLCRPAHAQQVRELVGLVESERQNFREAPDAAKQLASDPLGPLPDGMAPDELAAWTVASNVLLNLDGVMSKR